MFWNMYLLKFGVILDICVGFQGGYTSKLFTFLENQPTSSWKLMVGSDESFRLEMVCL